MITEPAARSLGLGAGDRVTFRPGPEAGGDAPPPPIEATVVGVVRTPVDLLPLPLESVGGPAFHARAGWVDAPRHGARRFRRHVGLARGRRRRRLRRSRPAAARRPGGDRRAGDPAGRGRHARARHEPGEPGRTRHRRHGRPGRRLLRRADRESAVPGRGRRGRDAGCARHDPARARRHPRCSLAAGGPRGCHARRGPRRGCHVRLDPSASPGGASGTARRTSTGPSSPSAPR